MGARRLHALGVAFISLQEQRLRRLTISRKRLPAATPTAVSRDARPAEGFPNLLLILNSANSREIFLCFSCLPRSCLVVSEILLERRSANTILPPPFNGEPRTIRVLPRLVLGARLYACDLPEPSTRAVAAASECRPSFGGRGLSPGSVLDRSSSCSSANIPECSRPVASGRQKVSCTPGKIVTAL